MPTTTQRVFAGAREKVPEGGRLVIDVGEITIGLFRVGGRLYAYLNKCAHEGGPVCQGKMIPRVTEVIDERGESHGFAFDEARPHIVCPWHGFEYDIKTGEHPGLPGARLIRVPVEEAADGIYVTV
jgi:nitrite reductase/ring-hydroxylating ferredoxin subunit